MDTTNQGPTQPSDTVIKAVSEFHPLDESNLWEDFKVFFTRPRYFFEFFVHSERIDRVVWAKVLLTFLALSALNSMISFSESNVMSWSTDIQGLDPRVQAYAGEFLHQFGRIFSQTLTAVVPFFTLLSTAASAAFCIFMLRLLGGDSQRMTWSGIFCTLVAAQWTTVFGFLPGVGTVLIAVLPIIYAVVGLAQIARLSKFRTFVAAFVLPGILFAICVGIIVACFVALGAALFGF